MSLPVAPQVVLVRAAMTTLTALLLVASICSVTVDSLTDPSVPQMFFPFGSDIGDSVLPVGDDTSSPAVNIFSGFPFLYGNYSTAFVSSFVSTF